MVARRVEAAEYRIGPPPHDAAQPICRRWCPMSASSRSRPIYVPSSCLATSARVIAFRHGRVMAEYGVTTRTVQRAARILRPSGFVEGRKGLRRLRHRPPPGSDPVQPLSDPRRCRAAFPWITEQPAATRR